MADFILNQPSATSSPWNPAKITDVVSTLKCDTSGFRPSVSGTNGAYAMNGNFNLTNMTTTVTIGAGFASVGDDVFPGILATSGVNAGAFIGCFVQSTQTSICTVSPAGVRTTISTGTAYTRASGDVISVNVAISGGTATVTVTINGGAVTYNLNTTTLYTSETSLACGWWGFPQNNNLLYITQFTATGLSANNPVVMLGQTGASYVTPVFASDLTNTGGAMCFGAGYSCTLTGNATMAYVYTQTGGVGSNFKICVYQGVSTGATLVATSSIGAKQGNTLIAVPITAALTLATQYTIILTFASGANFGSQIDSSAGAFVVNQYTPANFTYLTPNTTLPAANAGTGSEFTVWLEGTAGAAPTPDNSSIIGLTTSSPGIMGPF